MQSQNIKMFRMQKGLTQKELADLLHVTAQAVSRWEKGDVQPSIDTISEMAKIFEVTTDELITGVKNNQDIPTQIEENVIIEQAKPVLALCEKCNKPIFDSDDIVRLNKFGETKGIICSECDAVIKQQQCEEITEFSINQRKKSFLWSSLIAFAVLLCEVLYLITIKVSILDIITAVLIPIMTFCFSSCLILKNNFVGEMFISIASWGFVRFPGLIFSFDLDGFIWLIGMKILFLILGVILGFLATILALIVSLFISIFVYPFALCKNIKYPEETDCEILKED